MISLVIHVIASNIGLRNSEVSERRTFNLFSDVQTTFRISFMLYAPRLCFLDAQSDFLSPMNDPWLSSIQEAIAAGRHNCRRSLPKQAEPYCVAILQLILSRLSSPDDGDDPQKSQPHRLS